MGLTPCVPGVPHMQGLSVSQAPVLQPLWLAGGIGFPHLWLRDPTLDKSQISECFCFSLQCVPPMPVSQPPSKAPVLVTVATSAGNDRTGPTSTVPGPAPPPKLSDSGQVTLHCPGFSLLRGELSTR